ncbi:MAG: hypothetical protein V3T40_03165 [Nitrososphaerales archaeon]
MTVPQSSIGIIKKKGFAGIPFNEMLQHVKLLLILKGGCSKGEIKNQFRNLKGHLVEAFLSEGIKRGIIEVDMGGTYTLRNVNTSI